MNFSTKNLRREGLYGVCALMMTLNVEAERLPEMPLKTSLNGVEVSDMGRFIPGLGDYTLEGKAKVGRTIRIAFSGVEFEPTEDGDVRLVQKDGTVYVFQNGRFESLSSSHPMYEEGKNVVKNPSFEIVAEDYGNGRWRPADWETWNGGMPTWGGDVGKTNVRENAAYRSDGVKSIIMHSESRYLMQELAEAVVEPGAYYCLSYDYWTSEGVGNGGSTYRLMFGTERNTGNILDLKGHTTELNGTARCHFVTSFRMPDELPQNLWFSFFRGESKVDWIDNVKLVKIMPDAQGLSGLDNATYVEGQAYAPENLALEGDDYMDMTGRLVNPSFDEGTNGLCILSGTCIVFLFKIGGQGIHMMPDLMMYFQNMFVVFCLIPVVFQYALGNPLFFLFAADVSHDTEEYGIHHESKYCKQYKHNMDNYIIGKIYYA